MKALYGSELVKIVRHNAEIVKNRLWITTPYLGSLKSMRRILGNSWYKNSGVNVKLLTDISDLTAIDTETCRLFHGRGEIRSILGLHAKIYIFDDNCIVSSANLTDTAFSKRHEIGLLLDNKESKNVIDIFKAWWSKSDQIKLEQIDKIYSPKTTKSDEEIKVALPPIWEMPPMCEDFVKSPEKRFLDYERILDDYRDFCAKYCSIQRIWPNEPIYFEIDGLLNYLYHNAPSTPSKKYSTNKPRSLTESQQFSEIKKWAAEYKKWNSVRKKASEDDIEFRKNNSQILINLLSKKNIKKLTIEKLKEALKCLNTYTSRPINKTKLLNNNELDDIIEALDVLVNGEGELAERMNFCNNIKYIGPSSMNEIIAYTSPDKYPIINTNTNSGMRFFGYQIRAY